MTVTVMLQNNMELGGFQFSISGAEVEKASGGIAGGLGYSTPNGVDTVLGYSIPITPIPTSTAGQPLVVVELKNLTGPLCFTDTVSSDVVGIEVPSSYGPCITPQYDTGASPFETGQSNGFGDSGLNIIDTATPLDDDSGAMGGDDSGAMGSNDSGAPQDTGVSLSLDSGVNPLDSGVLPTDSGLLTSDSSSPVDDTSNDTATSLGNMLYLQNYNETTEQVEVWLINVESIFGFQADLSGAGVSSGSGGAADAADYTTAANGGATFLGFSITLNAIDPEPTGQHLTTLDLTGVTGSELCLENQVLSDAMGNAIPSDTGACLQL